MRKITRDAINAFMAGNNFSRDNTQVSRPCWAGRCGGQMGLLLHSNLIAIRNAQTGKIQISDAGWPTNTTKERLNGIPGVSIHQKAGQWYLNGVKWDGGWITI